MRVVPSTDPDFPWLVEERGRPVAKFQSENRANSYVMHYRIVARRLMKRERA